MTENDYVIYDREPDLDVAEFRRVLVDSGLGAIRPVDDEQRLSAMLSGADLIVTARLNGIDGKLVGFARCMTDFSWTCYVADLAVCGSAQGFGIGTGLLDEIRRQVGPGVTVLLVSVPQAVGFYEGAGMDAVRDVFWFRREW